MKLINPLAFAASLGDEKMGLKKRVEILEKKTRQSTCEHGWEIAKIERWGPAQYSTHAKCRKCDLSKKVTADKEAVQALETLLQKIQ